MAKNRYVNTRFWGDGYIAELNSSEKLLFLYFLTNPSTNICGVYELPLKTVAFDTGLEIDEVRNILSRFSIDNKIIYENGWVIIKNFAKHQKQGSENVVKGIKNVLRELPDHLKKHVEGLPRLEHLNPNSNLNSNSNELFDRVWKIYPKKVGKLSAQRAFSKKNPTEELTSQIISAIERSKRTPQWTDNEGRYIPHLATYLNGERYLDDLGNKPRIKTWEKTEKGMRPVLEPDYKNAPVSDMAKNLGASKRIPS